MTTTGHWASQVVPAQLSFLAIYNPSLGPTDETFRDQVVFYYSRVANEARIADKKGGDRNGTSTATAASEATLKEEENEKLRQIGLAQGMVDFARSFSEDEPVDSVETEKSRIVMRELEKGWWILAVGLIGCGAGVWVLTVGSLLILRNCPRLRLLRLGVALRRILRRLRLRLELSIRHAR